MSKDKGKMPSGKNEAAVELGRLGGKARAAKLTPKQRKDQASHAAKERWKKKKGSVEGH